MKIGIIGGCGVVGSAVIDGFRHIGHDVIIHDIILNSSVHDVLDTELCFICVPSPSKKETGACDSSIVESVISDLMMLRYSGVICIKSTVEPGTTTRLARKYKVERICFVPEFLRERCASDDFIKNHDVCIVGTHDKDIFDLVIKAHGNLPRSYSMISPEEAEICKYFNNIYNATLITLANSFYEVCKSTGANYDLVKSSIVMRDHIGDTYLNCNENLRGFGGMCLPKDLRALSHLCKKRDIDVSFFDNIIEENIKYPITVFDGMRDEKNE